jgi:serine/threonine protein phosphatase PrpC
MRSQDNDMAEQSRTLDVASLSDIGLKRQRNEDFCEYRIPSPDSPEYARGALFILADGMGGMGGGDVASKTAVQEIVQQYYAVTSTDPLSALKATMEVANIAVRAQAERVNLPRIGATAAGLVLLPDGEALWFNVGDSRVYRVRQNSIEQISRDQSVLQHQLDAGYISEEEARVARNVNVTAFIGQPTPIEPVYRRAEAQLGDVYILCSDGLWDLVEPNEILHIVQHTPSQAAARKLIALARKRGAPDNVTVILVRLGTAPHKRRWWWGLAALGAVAVAAAVAAVVLSGGISTHKKGATATSQAEVVLNVTQTTAATVTAIDTATGIAAPGATDTPTPRPPQRTPTTAMAAPAVIEVFTPTPLPTGTVTETETIRISDTPTARPPSRTPTGATAVPGLIVVFTPTPSVTRRAPTSTPTPVPTGTLTATPTERPTATFTATQTRTSTRTPTLAPPTTAPASTPTVTGTPSATRPPTRTVPPTRTAPPTMTPIPTDTETREPTVTLNPHVVTWTPTPVPSATPTLTAGEQTLAFAAEDGVILADQAQLYTLSGQPPAVTSELTLEAGTQVRLSSDVQQPHPDQSKLILREVEVTDGPNQGRTGWLSQSALESATPVTPHVTAQDPRGVNVRRGDSKAYPIVGKLSAGESAKIVGLSSQGSGWLRIVLSNGGTGWVAPDVVLVTGDTSKLPRVSPPPSPTPTDTPIPVSTGVPTGGPPPIEPPATQSYP